jgi:hypothetical protein
MNNPVSLLTIAGLVLLSFEVVVANGPSVQWERTFGGSGDDHAYSVQQTSDGGYIIAGLTPSFGAGEYDVYLIKTGPDGNMQWQKTFGGTEIDRGESVQQTSDGGYIIAGVTYSFGAGSGDVYLIKTDSDGNMQWQKTFGGGNGDVGESVQQTCDGGYIIAGWTLSFGAGERDVYLIKTDPAGNIQWEKTFGGNQNEWGYSVQQIPEGGYIIVGRTYSYGEHVSNVYLINTDSDGNSRWQRTFGISSSHDSGNSVQWTCDGGYIIAGWTWPFTAGKSDVYLIKTDSAGFSQWQKIYAGSWHESALSIQQTSDGGYIMAGYIHYLEAGKDDVYLIKTDSAGNMQWEKTLGEAKEDVSFSVQQTSDGGYVIAGYTKSFGAVGDDVYLIKLSSPADIDVDGDVDSADFATLASQWLQPPSLPSADIGPPGGDNIVDFQDLAVIAKYWLEGTRL